MTIDQNTSLGPFGGQEHQNCIRTVGQLTVLRAIPRDVQWVEVKEAASITLPLRRKEEHCKNTKISDVWLTVHRNSVWIRKTN